MTDSKKLIYHNKIKTSTPFFFSLVHASLNTITFYNWFVHSIEKLKVTNLDFSRARAVQEQGISARRRSVLLRGLNNAVPVLLWLAFGEEHQMPFYYFALLQSAIPNLR